MYRQKTAIRHINPSHELLDTSDIHANFIKSHKIYFFDFITLVGANSFHHWVFQPLILNPSPLFYFVRKTDYPINKIPFAFINSPVFVGRKLVEGTISPSVIDTSRSA